MCVNGDGNITKSTSVFLQDQHQHQTCKTMTKTRSRHARPTGTDRLQPVLNAAARVITGTRKFDHGLSDLLHSELHWLDIYQRVQYKLGVTIYRCLQNRAPQYLVDCCVRMSDVSSRLRLRSANRRQLVVPRHRRSKFGRRSFSVAAPMVWNSFPDSLRDPTLSIHNFRSTLKTHLFAAQRDT